MASHSHYFWPDISLEGHTQYWLDSAKYSDKKWSHFLGENLSSVQNLIAEILNFDRPQDIAFAPNTHELLYRLLSCFFAKKETVKVLTTDCEFHSFSRQIKALEENDRVQVARINPDREDFDEQFLSKAKDAEFIFISQVFFNTGKALPLSFFKKVCARASKDAIICIDGYHGFCALPTDISSIRDRIFYLAGGYKYAQAGEGMCFMTLPKDCQLRPEYTGWFAHFSGLENPDNKLGYDRGGMRFWGSTQDLSAHYRFKSVWSFFKSQGLDVAKINQHIKSAQQQFIDQLDNLATLYSSDVDQVGHFLTFQCTDTQKCKMAHDTLAENGVLTDYRGKSLRLGFSLYLDPDEVAKVAKIANSKDFSSFLN